MTQMHNHLQEKKKQQQKTCVIPAAYALLARLRQTNGKKIKVIIFFLFPLSLGLYARKAKKGDVGSK